MLREKFVIILFIIVYVGCTNSPTKLSNTFTNKMLRVRSTRAVKFSPEKWQIRKTICHIVVESIHGRIIII